MPIIRLQSDLYPHVRVMEEEVLFPLLGNRNGPGKQEEANRLPITDRRAEILDTIRANQVVLLSGPTGCGKSTQVPQFILDQHADLRKPVNILVTQPRKIAASSVARRVCKERGWMLGGLVGYQVILFVHHFYPGPALSFLQEYHNYCTAITRWGLIRKIGHLAPSFSM